MDGRITIPYIRNFFDVDDDEPGTALLASSRRNISINISGLPCEKPKQPMEQWINQTKETMNKLHLIVKPEKKAALKNMEYFCYVVPTAAVFPAESVPFLGISAEQLQVIRLRRTGRLPGRCP